MSMKHIEFTTGVKDSKSKRFNQPFNPKAHAH